MLLTSFLLSLLLHTSWADGHGEAINFPIPLSTSNYVKMANPDMTAISEEFSVCGWLRPSVLDGYNTIFGYVTSSSDTIWITRYHVQVHYYGVDFTSLEKDVWSHMCVTWDYQSYTWYAYINGTLVKSYSTPQKPIPSGGTIVLGQDHSVGGNFVSGRAYGGDIYNLNILDKRLADSEVEALYNQGLCGSGVNEDFSDRIVVSWEDLMGAPRYGGVSIQPGPCVLDLQSELAEKEKLLNATLEQLRDTKAELNSTQQELTSTKIDLQTKTVALNLTQQELTSTKMELSSKTVALTGAIEEMSRPVSHWDILFNKEYLNKRLTDAHLENLKNMWKPLEDFTEVNITENVIQHFKTCSATCSCDCDSEN